MYPAVAKELYHLWIFPAACPGRMFMEKVPASLELQPVQFQNEVEMPAPFGELLGHSGWVHFWKIQISV